MKKSRSLIVGASQEVVIRKHTVQSLGTHAELKHVGSTVEVSITCRTEDSIFISPIMRVM